MLDYLAVLSLGALLGHALTRGRRSSAEAGSHGGGSPDQAPPKARASDPSSGAPPSGGDPSGGGIARDGGIGQQARAELYGRIEQLGGFFNQSAHPSDLLAHEDFRAAVEILATPGWLSGTDLVEYYAGDNAIVSCAALAALQRLDPEPELGEAVLKQINTVGYWPRWFALQAVEHHLAADRPIAGMVLARVDDSWSGRAGIMFLVEFVRRRLTAGEEPEYARSYADEGFLREVLDGLSRAPQDDGRCAAFAREVQSRIQNLDLALLRSVGQVETEPPAAARFCAGDHLDGACRAIHRGLVGSPRRSSVVAGESGVGKTSCVQRVLEQLLDDGWVVFTASSTELTAGQYYVGSLEQRLQDLVRNLSQPKVVWRIPDIENLVLAGQHMKSETGVLDILLPVLDSGQVVVVAEADAAVLERLFRERPRLRAVLDVVLLEPLADGPTRELARAWAEHHAIVGPDGTRLPAVGPDLLEEASQLAHQYLGDMAQPGSLLTLLELARQQSGGERRRPLDRRDLIGTLARLTGLPTAILDDSEGLDLEGLRAHFAARVMGQPEAVDALVERVAMIKAGLTDPKRPPGVFLFVGPTGTGKTEIVKALADFLFGSEARMVRLDMGEFQTPADMDRILGSGEGRGDDRALVHQIRKQPFSVVLLDEFEKAHPNIWDLFLQVFDDGRLTDRSGRVADCRHAVFILTSNLGAKAAAAGGLAFGAGGEDAAERILRETFRPEFLNRIDRIVRFRALDRADLRAILRKELDRVLDRRGLRNRQWAVEWDPSAVDFLLQQGFTPDLGARPLRRAIERWLLAPLAETIVRHEAPDGDQFLFVRSDGASVQVDFVDPDAPVEPPESPVTAELGPSLRRAALEARGDRSELELVGRRLRAVADEVAGDGFQQRRRKMLAAMEDPAFWQDPGRFGVLGQAEYATRIATAVESSCGLHERLAGTPAGQRPGRDHCDPPALTRHALRVWLLEHGLLDMREDRPPHTLLAVEVVHEPRDATRAAAEDFAVRLLGMYRAWASRRQMHWRGLDSRLLREGRGRTDPRAVGDASVRFALVDGLGCHRLLEPEQGLHVYEIADDTGSVRERLRVRVTAASHDGRAEGVSPGERDALVRRLWQDHRGEATDIVRRYREGPEPLVRDAVRGYRSGRVDRVFAGDFDLLT